MARAPALKKHDIRLTSGRLRGQPVQFKHPRARPTTQRTREAMINILRSHTRLGTNDTVGVLFAGSGAVGFEVASSFGSRTVMVDNDPKCLQSIRTQAQKFELDCPTVRSSVRETSWLDRYGPLSGILADPPYRSGWTDDLCWLLAAIDVARATWFMLETETAADVQNNVRRQLPDAREYTYGNTQLWFGTTAQN